jgi:hypothetical protein
VVSDEDTVSACSSLKGLWRWVGLLVDALLLVKSEAVERGPLTVSVRSPSGRTRRQDVNSLSDASWAPEYALSQGKWVGSSQGSLTGGPVSRAEAFTEQDMDFSLG